MLTRFVDEEIPMIQRLNDLFVKRWVPQRDNLAYSDALENAAVTSADSKKIIGFHAGSGRHHY